MPTITRDDDDIATGINEAINLAVDQGMTAAQVKSGVDLASTADTKADTALETTSAITSAGMTEQILTENMRNINYAYTPRLLVAKYNQELHVYDSIDGEEKGFVYSSIQSALDDAKAGSVVIVHSGGYSENVTLKEGVAVLCMHGTTFYNSEITATGINKIKWLGDATFVNTDVDNVAMIDLELCQDYYFECLSIVNFGGSETNAARAGFLADKSSGELIVKGKSFTYYNEIISITNDWDTIERLTVVRTGEVESLRESSAFGSTQSSPIGFFNGATVDWHVNGRVSSTVNNCFFVGRASSSGVGLSTTLNVYSNGVIFDGANSSMLAVGHADSPTTVNLRGITNHRSPKFAHSTGSGKINTTLNVYAPTIAAAGDTDSVFVETGYGTLTIDAGV